MSDETFLGRWSRRKAASRRAVAEAEPDPAPAEAPPPAADALPAPAEPVAELPPVATLTRDSDFTPFLKDGVPEGVRKAALQALWRSDPAWAGPELLDLHNLDYTLPTIPPVVRTAYEVGKGFLDAAERQAEAVEKAIPAAATDADKGAGPALSVPARDPDKG